jgi:hypothetical protein
MNDLIKAVDTAVWCLAVKKHTKKGQRCKGCEVNLKASLDNLEVAYLKYLDSQKKLVGRRM